MTAPSAIFPRYPTDVFSVESFVARYPFVFHTTRAANLARLRSTATLECATRLLERAGEASLSSPRERAMHIEVDGSRVVLMDQAPLSEKRIAFADGYSFRDLIARLNELVFFWPGTASGPIAMGREHLRRYLKDEVVTIRVPTAAIVAANAERGPLFCRFNSGAPGTTPRKEGGVLRSPRGRTHLNASHCFGSVS
jgi:hypothetical protein